MAISFAYSSESAAAMRSLSSKPVLMIDVPAKATSVTLPVCAERLMEFLTWPSSFVATPSFQQNTVPSLHPVMKTPAAAETLKEVIGV